MGEWRGEWVEMEVERAVLDLGGVEGGSARVLEAVRGFRRVRGNWDAPWAMASPPKGRRDEEVGEARGHHGRG